MKIPLVVGLALSAFPANAAAWQWFGHAADGSNVAIDLSSIYRDGARVKFWTKWDFSGVKSRKEHSSINLNLGDCQQNSLGLISTTGYTVDGSVTWSQSFPEYAVAMDPAIPESIGDMMLKKACAIAAGTDKGF